MNKPRKETMIKLSGILFLICLTAGCASQPQLTIFTQPPGGYITELGSGTVAGTGPATFVYPIDLFKTHPYEQEQGCAIVTGLRVQWVSGAVENTPEFIKLCGNPRGAYNITVIRPENHEGLEKDLQFAINVETLAAQRQQAQSSSNLAAAALFNAFTATQPTPQRTPAANQPFTCRTRTASGGNTVTNCN